MFQKRNHRIRLESGATKSRSVEVSSETFLGAAGIKVTEV